MRHYDLRDVGALTYDLSDFALRIGVIDVSTNEDVEIAVVDVVDRVHQGAPDNLRLLPSREHQRKWLFGFLRHLFNPGLAVPIAAAEPPPYH